MRSVLKKVLGVEDSDVPEDHNLHEGNKSDIISVEDPVDNKNPEDYPPQFEDLVKDYNELNERYQSMCRLAELYEYTAKELQRTNDLLLVMNANLSGIVKNHIEDHGS